MIFFQLQFHSAASTIGIGCTKITKAKNEGSMNANVESRAYLEKKLVFCFGSYVAAQLLLPFGEENILSSSELKQAQEIATRMVIQYGWGPDDSPTIYHHGHAVTALSMGNSHEYEMAAKVEKIYYLAYDKARAMLHNNRRVLEKIVEELLEFEILTGQQPCDRGNHPEEESRLRVGFRTGFHIWLPLLLVCGEREREEDEAAVNNLGERALDERDELLDAWKEAWNSSTRMPRMKPQMPLLNDEMRVTKRR
ncbi:unnamed protein product [Ilex paraguariensis]|uniref:Peptidase M41 domain-containing protein n=1 Tax=Ilex paraguariensis TaxID=185542 RepID=A0ABC8SGP7_9AQUA